MIQPSARRLTLFAATIALLVGWGCGTTETSRFGVRLVSDPADEERAIVEFVGVPPALAESTVREGVSEALSVRTVVLQDGKELDVPPLSGTWGFDGELLSFRPRFPLSPGIRLRARYAPGGEPEVSQELVWSDAASRRPTEVPKLTAIYPSSRVVPANLLKIYLHFSCPMATGEVYQRVRLVNVTGDEVKYPFLELDEELWNRDGTRLTVFFDPGRIKRELRPNQEVGPALEEGSRYRIEVDGEWPNADGVPLGETYRHAFDVAAPDRITPDPNAWKQTVPPAASSGRFTVYFPEPLDHALTLRLLRIVNSEGVEIDGRAEVGEEERSWSFQPTAPWKAGRYELRMESHLEDLAGNSIGRPFEVDVFREVRTRVEQRTVAVGFEVR